MTASSFLFEAIKAHLRSRSLTYAELADGLHVSEGTIKRIFSTRRCSTAQIDAMCEYLQLDLTDLAGDVTFSQHLVSMLQAFGYEDTTFGFVGDPIPEGGVPGL